MIKLLSEEEAEKAKARLKEELELDTLDESKEYTSTEINWVDELCNWQECKQKALDEMTRTWERAIFIAHSRDSIIGKPQLVHPTMQKITILKKVTKINHDRNGTESYFHQIKFLDDTFDKRYDGIINWEWSQDFWIYKMVHEKKNYYILSKQELPMQECKINGMLVEIRDFTELSKSMKMKSISKVFFLKEFESTIKLLDKESIVEFTKERKITEEVWNNYLGFHPLGTINKFPKEAELLRSIQLLSGKIDGYPLHICILGPPGTKKSMGYIETIAHKFDEDSEIVEGGNSRIKGLSPSFKEKPANIGYLARCQRMGWVDEIGKMVEFEVNKHQQQVTNVLGELNFLLDHKKRTVGSGNDNDCVVKAEAKFLFVTNPIRGKNTIYNHIGIIDPTTMSRILWWVQDYDEQEYLLSKKGLERPSFPVPPSPKQALYSDGGGGEWGGLLMCWGEFLTNRDEFLTLFDTCNSFVCNLDDKRVREISDTITLLSKEPMKSVWRPRGEHHTKLVVDGICKIRCLFRDYDPSFEVKSEDYDLAREFLIKMVNNWDVDLSIKQHINYEEGFSE